MGIVKEPYSRKLLYLLKRVEILVASLLAHNIPCSIFITLA